MDGTYADMAELADAPDLGSGGQPCRFDPCYPHQTSESLINQRFLVYWAFFFYIDNAIKKALYTVFHLWSRASDGDIRSRAARCAGEVKACAKTSPDGVLELHAA